MSDRATSEDNLLSLLGLIQISVAQIQQSEKKTDFSNYKQESGPESLVMRARFLGTFL